MSTFSGGWTNVSWIDAANAFSKKGHEVEKKDFTDNRGWHSTTQFSPYDGSYRIREKSTKIEIGIPKPETISVGTFSYPKNLLLVFATQNQRDQAEAALRKAMEKV